MLPQSHPYIKNYLKNKDEIRGLGNTVRIVVENTQGSILDADFLEKFRQINDEVFLTVGVDRAWVKSIWMPVMRWIEITEEGFSGGAVMPHDYDGSEKSLQQLRLNIVRANLVGSYVATNFKSSMILVPLMDIDQNTGKRLDYTTFSNAIEKIRTKYETTGKAQSQDTRYRICKDCRRSARWLEAGHDLLCLRNYHIRRIYLSIYALRSQYGPIDLLFCAGGSLAIGHRRNAWLRVGPLLDSGTVFWFSRSAFHMAHRK